MESPKMVSHILTNASYNLRQWLQSTNGITAVF